MKSIIGIAGNERTFQSSDLFWLSYTSRGFVEGIQQAGGLPLIFPIGEPADAASYIKTIDKLLLAGGHDVNPALYGQKPHAYLEEINEKRDAFELELIKEAVKQGKAILGICRGMQLINVAFGGNLYQDISLFPQKTLKHVQDSEMDKPTHTIHIDSESLLGNFLPTEYQVNTYHHQIVHQVANNFQVIAHAPDGIVEAIQSLHFDAPILAIQWHPELTRKTINTEQQIFDYFVQTL